jgi:hypothetical protein
LNGIVLLQSGVPFSCQAGVNRSLSGGAGDRCDLVGSGPVATYGDGSVSKYFDTSRFALPALGTSIVRQPSGNAKDRDEDSP